MKLKKANLLFIAIILESLLLKLICSLEWEPEQLANITKQGDIIIDTNNYLEIYSESYTNILNYSKEIHETRSLKVYIYFIDSISDKYTIKGFLSNKKDIFRFLNDLAWFQLKGNVEDDKNSLFILFSVEDRQNRIRTGENVIKYVPDEKASKFLNDIKSDLRSKQYNIALENLMYNLNWRITKDTAFWDFMVDYVYPLSIILAICICLYYFRERNSDNLRDQVAESKLDKIKKISEKNKNNIKFVEDNCIICLEEFSPEEKSQLSVNKATTDIHKDNEINNETKDPKINNDLIDITNEKNDKFKISQINIEMEEKNTFKEDIINYHEEKSNLINKNEKDTQGNTLMYQPPTKLLFPNNHPNSIVQIPEQKKDDEKFLAILNCGHIFHSQCIVSWNKNHNACPICRKNIDPEENKESLLNIQNNDNYDNFRSQCRYRHGRNYSSYNPNYNLIENIIFVQTSLHPSLLSYNYDYSNGFSWSPPINRNSTNNNSSDMNFGSVFGRGAGGSSGNW